MNDKAQNDKTQNDKAQKDPPKFDWVTERSSCSLPRVFQALRSDVEEDIRIRNGLRPNNSPYEFSVRESGPEFTVLLQAKDLRRSVMFTLTEHAILIQDDKGSHMVEVTIAFNDHGECKLRAGGKECDPWQVRRMALEDLLFHGF